MDSLCAARKEYLEAQQARPQVNLKRDDWEVCVLLPCPALPCPALPCPALPHNTAHPYVAVCWLQAHYVYLLEKRRVMHATRNTSVGASLFMLSGSMLLDNKHATRQDLKRELKSIEMQHSIYCRWQPDEQPYKAALQRLKDVRMSE